MSKALVWLRNDLRLSDNPALAAAMRHGSVVALYIHETDQALRPPGGAARWWLHHSLRSIAVQLAQIGVTLRVDTGEATEVMRRAARGFDQVHWNRRYAPAQRTIDAANKSDLAAQGIEVQSHPGNVLAEPWTIATGAGKPYSVFTPFWRSLKATDIARPLTAPTGGPIKAPEVDAEYREPVWAKKLSRHWKIGEEAAHETLHDFLDQRLSLYPQGRDFPARAVTSRLSPHLRHGEISARQIWHAAKALAHAEPERAADVEKFLSELAWRDFNHHQLYHRPDISNFAMNGKYDGVRWREAPAELEAWKTGRTGIPLVDAGMRELWQTGFMDNRVRMLTASILAKNLLIDWRTGEAWFWDCLLDADVANNPGNWQWVAGSGMDASPYFRIFNPIAQGERFDAEGDYVRRFVPELAKLPDEWIQKPFDAPESVLSKSGVTLGETYPFPIVDLKATRARALEAMKAL